MVTPLTNNYEGQVKLLFQHLRAWKRKNNNKQYTLTLAILKKIITIPDRGSSLSISFQLAVSLTSIPGVETISWDMLQQHVHLGQLEYSSD